jgi:hypothetical protein
MNGGTGGIRILNFPDGSVATNIQADGTVLYISTGWDNTGNVYGGTGNHLWRAFSPPGANQATTPGLWTVRVIVQPVITNISVSAAIATIKFTGDPGDPASAFTLVSSGTVNGSYTPAAGASITGSGGSYTATASATSALQFYRIRR